MDGPHAPVGALCFPGNGPALAGGTEVLAHKGVAPAATLPLSWPQGSVLCGGRLAQGVRHAVGGELEGLASGGLRVLSCSAQSGAAGTGPEPSGGSVSRGGVCTNQGLAAMQGSSLWKGDMLPSGKFMLMVLGLRAASHSATGQTPRHLGTTGAGWWPLAGPDVEVSGSGPRAWERSLGDLIKARRMLRGRAGMEPGSWQGREEKRELGRAFRAESLCGAVQGIWLKELKPRLYCAPQAMCPGVSPGVSRGRGLFLISTKGPYELALALALTVWLILTPKFLQEEGVGKTEAWGLGCQVGRP